MALDRQCKIVLIGDGSVGKSSLIARFRTEGFAPRYHQTVGVDFFEKRLRLRGAQGVRLQIWDIGGQQTIRTYWRNYFEVTDGLVWVVDSADRWRLDTCRDELKDLLQEEQLGGASLLIFANKQDLPDALSVDQIAEHLDLGAPQFK